MFTGSIYDTPWTNHSRRGWTTLASFGLQAVIVGTLLMVPLIYTTGLPQAHWTTTPLFPIFTHDPAPIPADPRGPTGGGGGITTQHPLAVPREIGHGIPPDDGEVTAPNLPTGNGNGGGPGLPGIDNIPGANQFWITQPVLAHSTVHQPPISRAMESLLIYRVQPAYPSLAIQTRIQGSVVLRAVISQQGTIENLQVLSGHPMLVQAAINAVRQWRYRPYVLNGAPVEVETQVTVNFVLGGA